jgi:hypothetical protein
MRVEQVGLWLRRAIKEIVMLRQTSQCNHAKAARSKDNPVLPNSGQKLSRPGAGPPAEPARQHTRMRGGTPPDILSRRFRGANVQASRRVGFGTWALAVQLRPKPLARPRASASASAMLNVFGLTP